MPRWLVPLVVPAVLGLPAVAVAAAKPVSTALGALRGQSAGAPEGLPRMRLVRTSILLTALLGVAAALLAGCGGEDGTGTTTTAPATTAAASTTPTATTPAGPPAVLTATLTAAAAVPKGPAGAVGSARITLRTETGRACWTLAVRGIDRAVSAHVHEGSPGKLGPVVIPLGDRFARKGCVLSTPRALRAVVRRPGAHYVDVHTVEHLDGALRGPLRTPSG